jgi:hypothetical protein
MQEASRGRDRDPRQKMELPNRGVRTVRGVCRKRSKQKKGKINAVSNKEQQ